MRSTLNFLFILVVFVGAEQIALAQTLPSEPATGVATLFARDPLTQSFCFKDGGPGSLVQNGQVFNRCSDLNFNGYSINGFSVGIEGGREGVILDLGTPDELKQRHGYSETVGNGQGFASLDIKNGKVMILQDYKQQTRQELKESAQLFQVPKASAAATVRLGHIYLIRITDRFDKAYEMFAKLMVIAHNPSESVTFRWQVISDYKTAQR